MTSQIRIVTSAALELEVAYLYYESRQTALGESFMDAFQRSCRLLEDHPQAAPVLRESVRRKLIAGFPYGIHYRVTSTAIEILAVMNLNRRPDSWMNIRE